MDLQTKTASAPSIAIPAAISELGAARLSALVFAAAMLFTVGFAQSAPIHNAAHDTRHVQVFPCH